MDVSEYLVYTLEYGHHIHAAAFHPSSLQSHECGVYHQGKSEMYTA